MFHIRGMDVMMKILLPACFIALKLTGTFIDFMLGLSNSEVAEEKDFQTAQAVQDEFNLQQNDSSLEPADSKTSTAKKLLGSEIVESFSFRTCVNPKLTKQDSGETEIVYQSLTAQDLLKNKITNLTKLSSTSEKPGVLMIMF